MDWGSPEFVIAIVAISTFGWVINNWIRAKHGYDLEDEWGGKSKKTDSNEAHQLRAENKELKGQLEHVNDRMIVLEKIVTDRGYTLSEEIESLRHQPPSKSDNGVPLNLEKKESA